MSIAKLLTATAGQWQGTNKVWLDPTAAASESESVMLISPTAQGKFATFQYTWADDGSAQDGLLLVGSGEQSARAQALWVDSWHMQDKSMLCEGSLEPTGAFSVSGTYAAPPGSDWGWRIAVELQDVDTLRFSMYNVTPQGQEHLAVETLYRRKAYAHSSSTMDR